MAEGTARPPLLVLGLMPRTGTNFLARLLATHRDCTSARTLYEDFVVRGLPHLEDYVRTVAEGWQPHWPCHGREDSLRLHLGDALVSFLQRDAKSGSKRPVFKSPSVEGIDLLERFLPAVEVIIVLRQGPATIESGMRTFGWDFDTACRRWGTAAGTVLAVSRQRRQQGLAPLTLVRYEDLATNTEAELRRVFDQVDLDPTGFDLERLADFPVYGSSQQETVHWQPEEKTADFEPLARAADWPPSAFERFDRLTDGISADLGYDLPHRDSGRLFSTLRHRARDAKHWLPWRLQALLRDR